MAFEALKRCEGAKVDPVTFEPVEGDKVILSWQEHGIPQVVQFPAGAPDTDFPPIPKRMQSHGPELLAALRDAVDTTDSDATRYALGCIRLRAGKPGRNEGRIVAMDGRQLLLQSGFAFPWKGDVLVPASRIFACRELQGDSHVEIGKTEDWLTLRAGNWTIHLRIQKEARFPRVDDHIPEGNDADTTLGPAPIPHFEICGLPRDRLLVTNGQEVPAGTEAKSDTCLGSYGQLHQFPAII